jgi:hypothetical protein
LENPRSVEPGTSSSGSKVDSNEFKVMESITENVSRRNREENWNRPLGKDSREKRESVAAVDSARGASSILKILDFCRHCDVECFIVILKVS